MAGHSKWSKVKHIKGVQDARRGQLFSRLSKEITVAARMGGGNPDFNPRLRAAIQSARQQSMPADNIERAIKKGTGELAADALEEMTYEGYGPEGIAIIVETATDNKNRTASELRSIFSKNGGNLAASGSVAYLFQRKGLITLQAPAEAEEKILEILLEAGGEECQFEDGSFRILTPPDALYTVAEALRTSGFSPQEQKLTYQPEIIKNITDPAAARRILKLCDALEDCDDVLSIHTNFDLSQEIIEQLQAS